MTKEEKLKYLGDMVEDGLITYYKGGQIRAQKEAAKQAEQAYQLQLQEIASQKEQVEKLEQGASSAEAKEAARQQRMLAAKRKGRASTIRTIERKPQFADFEAKFRLDNPQGEQSDEDYMKKVETAYGQVRPFKRLIRGGPRLKKPTLYA